MLGPYSPKLTLPEKAALKAVEEGNVEEGIRRFLLANFSLVYQALDPYFDDVDLNAVLSLREEGSAPDLIAIRKLFWDGENVTAWGELFLIWEEGEVEDTELTLTLDELNDYLIRSTDFYEALEIELEAEHARVFHPEDPEVEPLPVQVPVLDADVISEELMVDETRTEEELLSANEDAFESVVEELADVEEELEGTSWDTIKVETIYWPREAPLGPLDDLAEQEQNLEFGGTSWDSIKVETIYWDKSKLTSADSPEMKPKNESSRSDAAVAVELKSTEAVEAEPPSNQLLVEEPEPVREVLESAPEPPSEEDGEGEELTMSHAPLDPFSKKNRLVVKNKYLGYGKNSEGVMGLCGQLKISYFKDEELVGRLESSNPLLFLSPNKLSGKSSTITYWLPPVAFPHPAGHIGIQTPRESQTLSLHTLFPKSGTDLMRDRSVVLCLFCPALIGFLYFALVYILTAHTIDIEAQQTFPKIYREAIAGIDTGDFRSQGLGLYRLRVVPASESLQMIWAAVIFFAPLLASKFFYYLSGARKRRFGGLLAASQLAPTVFLLLTWSFQDLVFPLYSHRDFAPMDLRGYLVWSVIMNILVAAYLFLSVFGVWDKTIKRPEVRFVLPFVLTGLYLLTKFVIIYGRSWFS